MAASIATIGAVMGALTAMNAGYRGWDVVAGAAIGVAFTCGLFLLPVSLGFIAVASTGVAATISLGAYNDWSTGATPSVTQLPVITSATNIIRQTQGFETYGERLEQTTIHVYAWDGSDYGKDPALTTGLILLSDRLVENANPVFVASTMVHELHHSFQPPIYKYLWGEATAYQAQSDFLRHNGISGTADALCYQFPTTDRPILEELARRFHMYGVRSPAIVP